MNRVQWLAVMLSLVLVALLSVPAALPAAQAKSAAAAPSVSRSEATPMERVAADPLDGPDADDMSAGDRPALTVAANVEAITEDDAESSVIFSMASLVSRARFFVHVVRRGETLSALALRFRTTVRALVRLNRLRNPNVIVVGQRLRIPFKRMN